ncbi:MAG: hypothetical protein Sapg2KO_52950 [Saprospiraceae bacterium]
MKKITTLLSLLLFVLWYGTSLNAQNVSASFTDANLGGLDDISGVLDGIPFDITIETSFTRLNTVDFTNTSNFCAPLTEFTQSLGHTGGRAWTITFEQPVLNLKVYLSSYRPRSNGAFSTPGVLLSGSDLTLAPDGVSLSITGFTGRGIIEFPGPLTTLSYTPNTLANGNSQSMTFGFGDGTDCGNAGGPACTIITGIEVAASDVVCNGESSVFTLNFDVTNGSGNYNIIATEANDALGIAANQVLGSITDGDKDADDVQIMGSIPNTMEAGSVSVAIVDADNPMCLMSLGVPVMIEACASLEPLPAMNRWGLILFSIMILSAGLLAYRRF